MHRSAVSIRIRLGLPVLSGPPLASTRMVGARDLPFNAEIQCRRTSCPCVPGARVVSDDVPFGGGVSAGRLTHPSAQSSNVGGERGRNRSSPVLSFLSPNIETRLGRVGQLMRIDRRQGTAGHLPATLKLRREVWVRRRGPSAGAAWPLAAAPVASL
jgi:hypothetical protein